LNRRLDKIAMAEIKTGKEGFEIFISDSYDAFAKKVMNEITFVDSLLSFSQTEKDKINEETMELLDPYLEVKDFNADRARTVANAAEGLCKWVKAMHSYHIAALIVGPKLEELQVKTSLYDVAMGKLRQAEASGQDAQDVVDGLQRQFEDHGRESAARAKSQTDSGQDDRCQ